MTVNKQSDRETIEVLIADDHPLVTSGLQALLESVEGIEVVGVASDGRRAVAMSSELQPDVVVMDLHMPVVDGVEATRQILRRAPNVAVLVLTMLDADDSVLAALRAGARGYLLKGAEPDDVLRGIRAVARGEAIFGPEIASRVLTSFTAPRSTPEVAFPELTDREREVLDLLAAGDRNTEIAQKLGLRPKTVRNHVSNILTKLTALDRTEAIIRAREAGLGRTDHRM
jgi:DNA-binding NarL/FixJ family response regulator